MQPGYTSQLGATAWASIRLRGSRGWDGEDFGFEPVPHIPPRPSLLTWQDITLTFLFPKQVITNIPVQKEISSVARDEQDMSRLMLTHIWRKLTVAGITKECKKSKRGVSLSLVTACTLPVWMCLEIIIIQTLHHRKWSHYGRGIQNGKTGPIWKKMTK